MSMLGGPRPSDDPVLPDVAFLTAAEPLVPTLTTTRAWASQLKRWAETSMASKRTVFSSAVSVGTAGA
jgi:hypothetical protein